MPTTQTSISRRNASEPNLYIPHPNLSDQINHNICQSEIEGGVFLDYLPVGTTLEVETCNRIYVLEYRGDGDALLCGHPKFCPEPVLVHVHGSTWGGSMLKMKFIGRGMQLEFRHPTIGIIHTSTIQDVRELPSPKPWQWSQAPVFSRVSSQP